MEYTRNNTDKHDKKDEHQLYISKLNVIHLEQKIYYKNRKYEKIDDNNEIMEKCKIQAKINYKKNVVDIICECGAPLKNKYSYSNHITTDKHINNMKIKYGN